MPVLMHYHIIGLNICECRKEQRLTQEKLAELAGISQQFLSRIERGKSIPSLETIMSLCLSLDIEPDRLLTRCATWEDSIPSRLRSDGGLSGAFTQPLPEQLLVIAPGDLPLFDLDLPDTEFDDLCE